MSGHVNMQQECTVYLRNLDGKVTEKLLEELFVQVGPVNFVTIRDSQQQHKGPHSADTTPKTSGNRYAFVEFADVESVLFACEVMDAVEIYGQKLKVQPRDNTLQRAIFTQMNMHTASWERHHAPAADSSAAGKGRPATRHSDIGVYNELERQSPGAGRGQRIVTFNRSHGGGGGQFVVPRVSLVQAQKMRPLPVRSHAKAERLHQAQTWSPNPPPPLNFPYPSGGPSAEPPHQQIRIESPNVRHFRPQRGDHSMRNSFRDFLSFNSTDFGGRRSTPYPNRERGHLSRESAYHGKFNR
ncbi:hypothetical protein niasHT_003925 [Heterodera trifolii]|uniref:RRM domain-containing protein n=1 Tax=Heterodera trifolii TaxID=157864 RepID=A0ABD2LWB6_9BILA